MTRTIHIGLGTIGQLVLARAVEAGLQPVAAVDIAHGAGGRDAGESAGIGTIGVTISHEMADLPTAELAFVCTGSDLDTVAPLLLDLARRGLHVVSTCEELAYPWRSHPDLALELDRVAKRAGIVILGTGVNPGFIMDTVVIGLARACGTVKSVRVTRKVDVSQRRLQLQRKVGVGLTPEQFKSQAEAGMLGHVGLKQSAQMVADALQFDGATCKVQMSPVFSDRQVISAESTIQRGRCIGIRQVAVVAAGSVEAVRLELEMAFGLAEPEDRITIDGQPTILAVFPGGVAGDQATAAIAVAAAEAIRAVSSGLRCMPELPSTQSHPQT